jgi:hypothetical protein
MLARVLKLCALVAFALFPLVGSAQTTSGKLGDNAALRYWQAFEQLPKPSPATSKIFDADWNTIPFDAAALKILNDGATPLKLFHRGAKLERCDWGIDYADGPATLLPQVQKARTLARLACFRARYRMEKGKDDEAVDDLLDVFALARHVGYKSPLISLLVGYALDQVAIETAARHLPKMSAKALDKLVAGLNKLPAGGSFRDALQADKQFGSVWLKAQLKEGKVDWPGIFGKGGEEVASLLARFGAKHAVKLLDDLDSFYEEAGRLSELPRAEFLTKFGELKRKQESNPFARMLFPAVEKVYDADCRVRARRQLFRAAIAIVQGGKEKLMDYPDPFGKGPFEYVELPMGFELRSKLTHNNQPVSIIVGVPKQN